MASGFKKVEKDKYDPRLLHVKGRRNIRVMQVRLAWDAMNSGDVFILDLGLTIYVWNGCEASRVEKIKALDVARRINNEERGARANFIIMGKCVCVCCFKPGSQYDAGADVEAVASSMVHNMTLEHT